MRALLAYPYLFWQLNLAWWAYTRELRKDLFHAVWELLIDDDFVHAKLFDCISRVGFPCFFFHSMDYPEKWFFSFPDKRCWLMLLYRVLVACIKYLEVCPCPRCLQLKLKIYLLGSKSEMRSQYDLLQTDSASRRTKIEWACKLIFDGVTLTSTKIKRILGTQCLVPTRVAVFTCLMCNSCWFVD